MEDERIELASLGRRGFLAVSGALAVIAGSTRLSAQPVIAEDFAQAWNGAETIPLWPEGTPGGGFKPIDLPPNSPPIFLRNIEQPYLRVFRPEKPNGRALLSIPGGAYTFVSVANEGLDIARDMTTRGYTVFVLVYRLPGEGWAGRADVPLQDAQRAMRIIKARAADYGYNQHQVYAVGFSAGGHLAATLATGFAENVYAPRQSLDDLSAKPSAVGLIYPVISQTEGIGHAESTLRLLGPDPAMADIVRRSPDIRVSAETPPVFLVHAMDDGAVPIENSLLIMGAMRGHRLPVEAHFFESGGHGFGAGRPGQPNAIWLTLFSNWLDSHAGRLHQEGSIR